MTQNDLLNSVAPKDTLGSEQILVVDDDQTSLHLLDKNLTDAGYSVHLATNGLRAIDSLYEYKPSIVISDWIMPKMTGIQFSQAINQFKQQHFIYFIMLTIRTRSEHLVKAFQSGVDDYICKPFNREELLMRVNVAARTVHMYNVLSRQAEKARRLNAELSRSNQKLKQMSITDPLTKLRNRRQSMTVLKDLWHMAQRYGQPVACAIIDVDHFKTVNDVYGHLTGDVVLTKLAATLSQSIRKTDHAFRFGGEEFLVIFPNTTAEQAKQYAQRYKELVAEQAFITNEDEYHITVSVGIAEFNRQMKKPEDMLHCADKSLYVAKDHGRNRVVLANHE